MLRRTPLLAFILVSGILIVACGSDDTPTPTTPTPPPVATPPPAPAPPPPPAEPPALASVTVNPDSVTGQGNPVGTVTLTAAAPAGDAVVTMSTGNSEVARVPSQVRISAGSMSNNFQVDTSTVSSSTSVSIIATYLGVTRTASLTVLPPPLVPRFKVTSGRGEDACDIVNANGAIDCLLDAGTSSGFVARYHWILKLGSTEMTFSQPDGQAAVTPSTTCGFLGNGTNDSGKLNMEVTLQLEDRAGNKSGTERKTVSVYHNSRCGF